MDTTYLRRQRHVLLDMHVPDWDPRFLSRYDPADYVNLCVDAGADAVMVYCNSHAGQCFWPARSGRVHANLAGRDVVGETVRLLHDRGVAVCGYYSAIFNNWAYTEHPEWRIVPSAPGGIFGPGSRYGVCCPNHPDYLTFMTGQTGELADTYPFDAFFFDMVFWPDVCLCGHCRARFRREEGAEVPTVVDWHSPTWTRFQGARERWLADAFRRLRTRVKSSADIPVFCNAAPFGFGWVGGASQELADLNDLLGGDFTMPALFPALAGRSPTVLQYMKAVSGYGGAASQLNSEDEQRAHALTATAYGGQFMAIDAVEPDGSVNPAAYKRLAAVFDAMKPFPVSLGSRPIVDVAVYWGLQATMDLQENQQPLDQIRFRPERSLAPEQTSPHLEALSGAVRTLLGEHVPVGVITSADLERLAEFPVIVLPNVLRMSAAEIDAFRDYVQQGGKLYASGRTSLLLDEGTRAEDFLLGDVFGATYGGVHAALICYAKPAADQVAASVDPLRYVPLGPSLPALGAVKTPADVLLVTCRAGSEVLATVSLPFADGRGSRDDQDWASIHASPPWEDTAEPAVVRHRFGVGETIYAASALEASPAGSPAGSLFVALVRSLLARPPIVEADAHPDVWMTAVDNHQHGHVRICFLNRPEQSPARPMPRIPFRVNLPGSTITQIVRLPAKDPVPYTTDSNGIIHADLRDLDDFAMVAVECR